MTLANACEQYGAFRKTLGERFETNGRQLRAFCRFMGPDTTIADVASDKVNVFLAGRGPLSAWALNHDFDPTVLKSNVFTLEWPPKSGKMQEFPEVDSGSWYSLAMARRKIVKAQSDFLTRLVLQLEISPKRVCD